MGQFNLGGGTHVSVLYDKHNFIIFAFFCILVVGLLGVFSLTWGLTAIIGALLFGMGFIIIVLNRGGGVQPWIFLACIVLGAMFMFLSYAGVEVMVVDLRFIPGLESVHNWAHGL